MRNVVLIGMPGAGKSTVGVVLAKILGFDFIDTDLIIQAKTKQKLYKFIELYGTEAFLKAENDCVKELRAENCVIATGGSVVYGEEAMENLKAIGTVVYLKLPEPDIEERITNLATRGIAMDEGQTLSDIYDERSPLYEKYADITIESHGKTISQIAAEIAEKAV
ncbi:MAG: shikimate kinase [Oscillospiraceae bacterium]